MQSFLYLLKVALIIIAGFVFLGAAIFISKKIADFIDQKRNKENRSDEDVKKTD